MRFPVPALCILALYGILYAAGADTAHWPNQRFLENEYLRVVVVPETGRITHLSRNAGENLLRQDKSLIGNTEIPPGRWDWNNHGGDWLWPVAQDRWEMLGVDRRWPPPALFEYAPWSAVQDTDGEILLWLDVGEPLNILVSRRIFFDPENPKHLIIEQSILRTAPSDIPVCLWQIAQMGQASDVEMKVPETTRHPGGVHHIQGPAPEQDAVILQPKTLRVQVAGAKGAKLGTDGTRISGRNPAGSLHIEVFNGDEPGELPDGGCSLALAIDRGGEYAELETMSVERNLAAGERLNNRLVYRLTCRLSDQEE